MKKQLNRRMRDEKMTVSDLERVLPGRKDIYALLDYGLNDNIMQELDDPVFDNLAGRYLRDDA